MNTATIVTRRDNLKYKALGILLLVLASHLF